MAVVEHAAWETIGDTGPSVWWTQEAHGDYAHVTWEERRRCIGRGHSAFQLGVLIQRNSIRQLVQHCPECGDYTSSAIKRNGEDLDSLPVVKDNRVKGRTCENHVIEPTRVITRDGRARHVMACLACGQQDAMRPVELDVFSDTWPILRDYRYDADGYSVVPLCEHCGSHDGTQLHHWAPRSMFDDAHRWPMSYLCPPCHRLWHQVVTPAISRKRSA